MSSALSDGFDEALDWLARMKRDGMDMTATAHVKLVHEAEELRDSEPRDIEELADVLIACVGIMAKQGWTKQAVGRVVLHKMRINRSRTWHQNDDGTWSHD